MPERERVAGMQAAVLELVDRAQVQVPRSTSLRTRASWKSPSPTTAPATCQSNQPEDDARERRPARPAEPRARRPLGPAARRRRRRTTAAHDDDRREQRARRAGSSRARANTTAQATNSARRTPRRASAERRALAERACDERSPAAARAPVANASRRYSITDHASSACDVAGGEEARAVAVVAPRSPRKTSARSRSDQSSSTPRPLGLVAARGAWRGSAGGRAGSRRTAARRARRRRRARPRRPG